MKTIVCTLLLVVKGDKILLAMKKKGFGQGRWNGVGGKVDSGETVTQAMLRETREEIGIVPTKYELVAINQFHEKFKGEWCIIETHIFLATEFTGEPTESDEMRPQWYSICDIPYNMMWPDDTYWLPRILAGEKLKCRFDFDENDKIINFGIAFL